MKRPTYVSRGAFCVEPVSLCQRILIDRDHRVNPFLVERDTNEILFYQFTGCDLAGFHGLLHLGNACLQHGKGLVVAGSAEWLFGCEDEEKCGGEKGGGGGSRRAQQMG